ncbi:MAG: MFS transporter, partial [Pseudomonadota bacterium]
DIFVGRGMARIMSLVMTIFMIVPILAPSIGQVVLYVAPWQWIFAALTIYGALIFAWVWFRVPETLPDGGRPDLSLQESARAYGEVFSTRVTLGYMAASGVIFGALFAFIGSAEQIMTEVYDTGDAFVVWFALVAATLSVATYTNSRLVERFGMRRLSQAALIGFIGFALLLLVLLSVFGERFYIFFPLFAAMFACFGMIGSNFNAMAMEPLGKIAGTASAAYGFATTTFSSLLGWIIGSQYNGSSIPVVAGFAVLGILCFAVVFVVERGKLFQCR